MQVITAKHDFASDRLPNNKYYGAIRPPTLPAARWTNVEAPRP
jgi:hypothetical protein